ncbi:hypothetical protein [Flavobacterium alkalisoli]|nr:hypothetical protein [Flavobacterium alkalisoli]
MKNNEEKACAHESRYTKVLDSSATCETTVTACTACGAHLDKPITQS